MLINTIEEHLSQRIINGELSNNDLVQLIEHIGGYLNLTTVAKYAKEKKMSYNGVKKFRSPVRIFSVKFIIDNN